MHHSTLTEITTAYLASLLYLGLGVVGEGQVDSTDEDDELG